MTAEADAQVRTGVRQTGLQEQQLQWPGEDHQSGTAQTAAQVRTGRAIRLTAEETCGRCWTWEGIAMAVGEELILAVSLFLRACRRHEEF